MAIIKDMTATNRKALDLIFLEFHRLEMHSEHSIQLSLYYFTKCGWFHKSVDGYTLLLWKEYY